eukprot:g1543.t1
MLTFHIAVLCVFGTLVLYFIFRPIVRRCLEPRVYQTNSSDSTVKIGNICQVKNLPYFFVVLQEIIRPFACWLAPLNEARLIARAKAKTGLEHFKYEEEFLPGLRTLLASAKENAKLSPFGRIGLEFEIVKSLSVRLKASALIDRHPEILNERIDSPLIIAALPRTGTTHLQRLLAASGKFRYLRNFEGQCPVIWPPISKGAEHSTLVSGARGMEIPKGDNRVAEAQSVLRIVNFIGPLLKWIHNYSEASSPEEEIVFDNLCFKSFLNCFLYGGFSASYTDWYFGSAKQILNLRCTKRMLQILQWQTAQLKINDGRKKLPWLLKTPAHFSRLPELFQVFPDAKVVTLHRNILPVLKSVMLLDAYISAPTRENDIFSWRNSSSIVMRLLKAYLSYRGNDNEGKTAFIAEENEQILDIASEEFFKDNMAVALRVLRFQELPTNNVISDKKREAQILDDCILRMEKYIKLHPRTGTKKLKYSLESFGTSAIEIQKEHERVLRFYETLSQQLIRSDSKGKITL